MAQARHARLSQPDFEKALSYRIGLLTICAICATMLLLNGTVIQTIRQAGGMRLDPDSPIPLYHQIERALLTLIREQNLSAGQKLPAEPELARRFGVTRTTVRSALERLVQQGVLSRQQGRGTFVVDPSPAQTISRTFTLILPNSAHSLYLLILGGAEQEARARGLQVVVALSQSDAALASEHIRSTPALGSVGLILWPLGGASEREEVANLCASGFPVVLVDRYFPDLDTDRVLVDDFGGEYQATRHLAGLGHRRIAFVYGSEDLSVSSVRLRWEGYRQALVDSGLETSQELAFFHPREVDPRNLGAMESLARQMLQLVPAPTAAVCINDALAQALLITLLRQRVRVPQDFSVVGFDGLEYMPVERRLTTVRRATSEMGAEAVRLLVARLNDGSSPARHVILPTELVAGETAAAAPEA